MRLRRVALGATMSVSLALPLGATANISANATTAVHTCHSVDLSPRVEKMRGSAATSYYLLELVNRSTRSCALSGVSSTRLGNLVGSGQLIVFKRVGPAATAASGRGTTVVLSPHAVASMTLGIRKTSTFSAARCFAVTASLAQVTLYRGSVSAMLYFPLPRSSVCTNEPSTATSDLVSGTGRTAAARGIVPIGTTNEGGSGLPNGPATGILDITAGPCVGMALPKVYESLRSLITLRHGSRVVASWNIYGEQRIAWVEPAGIYTVSSNQPTANRPVTIIVSRVRMVKVDLMPACK
jgi:Protein of unknown function (DUF4232)